MKTLKIKDKDWMYLQNLKLKYKFKRLDEIVSLFIIHCKEAIKKGDLELLN